MAATVSLESLSLPDASHSKAHVSSRSLRILPLCFGSEDRVAEKFDIA